MLDVFSGEQPTLTDAPAIVERLLNRAIGAGASDIHLLPQEHALLARLRVDGVLHDLEEIESDVALKAVSRVKVLAGLDVADHQKAQDGRLSFADIDVRVSVLPTIAGEGLVLRLLRTREAPPSLTELGLSNAMQMELERVLSKPNGLLLVSGPTGAGKSTTLYAALTDMNRPEVSTVTVEDPVEYRLPRAFQIQVSERRGLSFPTALRTILRSDPDIVMVGEIRDDVTAQLAIEAALSGHFVLSTLHSDDAVKTLARLSEMGIPRYLITTAVTAVLAQRLARKLCPHCREAYEPTGPEREQLGSDAVVLYRAHGCSECTRGYSGRVGIFQFLRMTDDVALAVSRERQSDEIAVAAASSGTESLWMDGLRKAEAGLTSVSELRRVL
jgi:type IV pilus assembly protein PilB